MEKASCIIYGVRDEDRAFIFATTLAKCRNNKRFRIFGKNDKIYYIDDLDQLATQDNLTYDCTGLAREKAVLIKYYKPLMKLSIFSSTLHYVFDYENTTIAFMRDALLPDERLVLNFRTCIRVSRADHEFLISHDPDYKGKTLKVEFDERLAPTFNRKSRDRGHV